MAAIRRRASFAKQRGCVKAGLAAQAVKPWEKHGATLCLATVSG
jgi:hypothetical protein